MRIIGLVVAALLAGCVPVGGAGSSGSYGGSYAAEGPVVGTGVYVNGQEITARDKAQLDDLLGVVLPAGRYSVDADGNAGIEGQPPSVNLVVLARQRQQQGQAPRAGQPVSMYSTDSAGQGSSFISDGNCTMVSTPDATLATDGC